MNSLGAKLWALLTRPDEPCERQDIIHLSHRQARPDPMLRHGAGRRLDGMNTQEAMSRVGLFFTGEPGSRYDAIPNWVCT